MVPALPSILVVDDDRDTCRNLSDILTDLGYTVRTAHDGMTALELVRRTAFDVVLLDFKMPGMDGLALYREIKRVSPATLAIMISAYLSSATIDEARRAGTWKVLSKPLEMAQLLPLVEEALSQPLVLLVDDDRDLCASLWDLLHERGYRVSLAHTAPVGKDLIAQRKFNVVLLDLKLPEGSAREVLAVLREANSVSRTMIITAHRQEFESLIDEVLAEGADAICYKPFDLNDLLAQLDRLAQETRNRV
jgi:two-component system, NtrC family, response regulator HydG